MLYKHFIKLNLMKLSDKERDMIDRLDKYIYNNKVSNYFLVQLIAVIGSYLNLMTISAYSKAFKLSYNGVKKCRETIELFGCKFVLDND